MRKLFTLMALSFAMAIAGGISISPANASPLTGVVHSLKVKQAGVVEKAYYYHRHYRRVARRHYRRAYYYGVLAQPIMAVFIPAITTVPIIMAVFIIAIIAALLAVLIAGLIIRTVIIIAVAGGITFIATAAGGLDKEAPGHQAWRFFYARSRLCRSEQYSRALRLMQSFSGLSSGVLALTVNKRSLWRP